jgi:hypothetical protein
VTNVQRPHIAMMCLCDKLNTLFTDTPNNAKQGTQAPAPNTLIKMVTQLTVVTEYVKLWECYQRHCVVGSEAVWHVWCCLVTFGLSFVSVSCLEKSIWSLLLTSCMTKPVSLHPVPLQQEM